MGAFSISSSLSPPAPSMLSYADLPGVWHADELAGNSTRAVATGHARLDAELPGGGWPLGAMTELLQPAVDAPVWSLVLPALVAHWKAQRETMVLVGPPYEPFMPALSAAGLSAQAVLWIRADTAVASLWAAEQALRCADVGAVMAWLPGARAADLRRLQGAAARRAGGLLFVLRPERVAASASPARLRIAVRGVSAGAEKAGKGEEAEKRNLHLQQTGSKSGRLLEVHILKRRGPPMSEPLFLNAQEERVQALLAAADAERRSQESKSAAVLPFAPQRESSYALDRIAVAA